MADKKNAKNRKPKSPAAPSVSDGKVVSADSIKFKPRPRRGTSYQPIIEKMKGLTAGKAIVIELPKGLDATTFMSRINSALSRFEIPAPKGCVFRKRATEDGNVAIVCESE